MITNKYGLPDTIVRAVSNDDYDRGNSWRTVTELINPPRLVTLRRLHKDELVEDVSDRMWILLGKAVHKILEEAGEEGYTEERVYAKILGKLIGGQTDRVLIKKKKIPLKRGRPKTVAEIVDWKVTSVWTILFKSRLREWEFQLNSYAYLWHANKLKNIDSLKVCAILRDWRDSEKAKDGYPPTPFALIDLPKWEYPIIKSYLEDRVKAHLYSESVLPECSDEDRWMNPKTRRFVRCERYCPVAAFCDQWQEVQKTRGLKENDPAVIQRKEYIGSVIKHLEEG